MRCEIEQAALKTALSNISSVYTKKVILDQLRAVLISCTEDGIKLIATNLEVWVEVKVPGEVYEVGEIAVPYRELASQIELYPRGLISFSTDVMNTIKFSAGRITSNLKCWNANEYPTRNVPTEVLVAHSWDAKNFFDALGLVSVSVAKESNRPGLQCIKFDVEDGFLHLISADGYRMTKVSIRNDHSHMVDTFLLKKDDLSVIAGITQESANIRLYFSLNEVWFEHGAVTLIVKKSEHVFPNVSNVRPKISAFEFLVNTAALLRACNQAIVTSRDTSYALNVEVCMPDSDKLDLSLLRLSSGSKELESNSEVHIIGSGHGDTFRINCQYLAQALSAMTSEEEVIVQGVKQTAITICSRPIEVGNSFYHVIMPMA